MQGHEEGEKRSEPHRSIAAVCCCGAWRPLLQAQLVAGGLAGHNGHDPQRKWLPRPSPPCERRVLQQGIAQVCTKAKLSLLPPK